MGMLETFVNEVTKSLGEIILNLGTWWVKAPVPSLFVTSSPAYKRLFAFEGVGVFGGVRRVVAG